MRKSIDTLCVLISETIKINPTEGLYFYFVTAMVISLKLYIMKSIALLCGIDGWKEENLSSKKMRRVMLK